MAKARKDNRGRALRKGESQRTDNTYVYTYTDPFKKRRFVYAKDLQTLREKQDKLKREQLDGLDSYLAGNATLNFVRNVFGERLIAELKYFYLHMLNEKGLQANTVDTIQQQQASVSGITSQDGSRNQRCSNDGRSV